MTYRFYININSVVTEVFPLNWLETSLVDEKEKDQVFYRRKFEGSLTFGGKKLCADFDLIYSAYQTNPCGRIYLLILRDLEIYWEGYFSPSAGDWDLDCRTVTVKPLPVDDYSAWSENGDVQYQILALPRVNTVFDDGAETETYSRSILLWNVIEYLAQHVFGAGVTVLSTFFTEATNPATLSSNRYRYLTIAQKSDVKRPTSTNPATNAPMSFNELMEILRALNLRWTYTLSTGVLQIEHISYWNSTAGIDVRTSEMAASSSKFRFLNEEMPKYETFKWMEAESADFVGLPIWYDSDCVSQDPDNNTSELSLNISTDIEFIKKCVDDGEDSRISDEGWVLFATELRGTDYYILTNSGLIDTGRVYFNCDLAWSRLHNNFWKHDRQLIQGYMNGTLQTFYSARKTKQQNEFSIVYCSEFDPSQHITTELGETYFSGEKGDVKKAVLKPYGEVNLTLVYGPASNPVVPVVDLKTIRIVESGICGQLHAVLSETSPVDLNIYIGYEILDSEGVYVCGEVPAVTPVWTIPAGAYTSDFTVSFDGAGCGGGIPVGGCWNPTTDFSDPESKGWTVFAIIQDEDCSC
jgi:hypothetical protein